jgi:hypothetical protein
MNVFAAQSTGFFKLDAPWFVPVEFLSFEANVNGSTVNLYWSTATELNNKGFDIQLSFDNLNFENIGFVPGFGTSSEKHNYNFELNDLKDGKYYFRLAQVDYDGTISYSNTNEVELVIPKEFALFQNYPNPFNPSTKISWQSPVSSWQSLRVYDALGNLVAVLVDEYRPAGTYEVVLESVSSIQHPESGIRNLASGIYLYKLQIGNQVQTKKMLLMK